MAIVGAAGAGGVSVGDAPGAVGVHEGAVDMIVGRGHARGTPGYGFDRRLVTGVTGNRIDAEECCGIHMLTVGLSTGR